jgi:hypothetical protein
MAQGVAKHWSVDTLDTFKAVFINSPYISLLGKYLKTGGGRVQPVQVLLYRGGVMTTIKASSLDLFGDAVSVARTNFRPEAAALVEVLRALRAHPLVAWAERMNSGAARIGGRFVRFGWTGCPDMLWQLMDGLRAAATRTSAAP